MVWHLFEKTETEFFQNSHSAEANHDQVKTIDCIEQCQCWACNEISM